MTHQSRLQLIPALRHRALPLETESNWPLKVVERRIKRPTFALRTQHSLARGLVRARLALLVKARYKQRWFVVNIMEEKA